MQLLDLTQERLTQAQKVFTHYDFGSTIPRLCSMWSETIDKWVAEVNLDHANPEYPSSRAIFEVYFQPQSSSIIDAFAIDKQTNFQVGSLNYIDVDELFKLIKMHTK